MDETEEEEKTLEELTEDAAEELDAERDLAAEAAKKRKDNLFMLFFCTMIILIFAAIGVGIYFLTGGASSGCTCGQCS